MPRLFILCLISGFSITVAAQQTLSRPKLIVGIVVDQMRWDYLYRYYDRYEEKGGFKRLMNDGFLCENTLIPYTPTYTAPGHACIFTGSVPAINGITGNFWWDREQLRSVYCTEDKNVNTVGSSSTQGRMSPRNMFVTTIGDELRIATNFQSKIIGISIKDRGGILPAGHSANAAYWYDNSVGNWITSSYYMNQLPSWVSEFNAKKMVDGYYREGWKLMYPASSYIQSTADNKTYEAKLFGNNFPYDLKSFIGKDYGKVSSTPMGNSLTAEFAKAAVIAEHLGADKITDLLAISFSSPDYIGHSFGPNSIESEDGFLRLDKELGSLFDFLDKQVGKGQYTVFLSADHGVAQIPEFMEENKMPAGRIFMNEVTKQLNQQLNERYRIPNIILHDDNSQLALNHPALDSAGLDKKEIIQRIINQLSRDSAIAMVFPIEELNKVPLPSALRKMMNNGYYKPRNGDIQFILKPNYFDAWSNTGTTHGLWNPYDTHIPLIWYGWGIKKGKTYRETYMTDIAPTIAALLNIQAPNGSIGTVIPEVFGQR